MKSALLTAPPASIKKQRKIKKIDISFEELIERDIQRTQDRRRLRLQRVFSKTSPDYWVCRLDRRLSEQLGGTF